MSHKSSSLLGAIFAVSLSLTSFSVAQAPPALKGAIISFNDSGEFLFDVGGTGLGKGLTAKLAGVVTKPGAGAFIKKFVPSGSLVTFNILNPEKRPGSRGNHYLWRS